MAVDRDITEHKKIENELRETRDYLNNLIDYANAPIIVWDPQFRITIFNHAFERLTGLKEDAVIGKHLSILFPENRKEESMQQIQRTLAGELWESVLIPIQHVDGTVKTALWNSANIFDSEGKRIVATIAQGHDITQRRELEEKLAEYAQHLEELVEEKTKQLKIAERFAAIGQTAGMVGHDIRNPLQAIVGAVYLAREEIKTLQTGTEQKTVLNEVLDTIGEQVNYINKIVSDLQDFSHPSVPSAQETDIRALLTSIVSGIKVSEKVEVAIHVEDTLNDVMIDPLLIKRIASNLIDNSIQAMPEGGKLTINAALKSGNLRLTVEDTGTGISEENKSKMFAPLFTTKAKGQGFGLAVAKKMVESMNGGISFQSEVGRGTIFTVEIPPQNKPDTSQSSGI